MNKLIIIALCFLSAPVVAATNLWEGLALPEFNLADQNGAIRSNKDFSGKWLVLYFYPKDKTSGCTIEAQNFTKNHALFQQLNTQIVGVSYDDVASHKEFSDIYEMPFALLADVDAVLSKQLKVDRFLPWPHASRQTFLVNPEGVIVHHIEDVNPNTHAQELIALLKEYQSGKVNPQ